MIEQEVSNSVRKFILREFHRGGKALWHYEATDTDGYRPDILIVIEYQSPNRQWVAHSVESKVSKHYVVVSDKRKTCSGVKQANNYLANYRWLAISKDVYYDLADDEWEKLQDDCYRYSPRVGLLVAYMTKVELIIQAGYHLGSWIEYYKKADWFFEESER